MSATVARIKPRPQHCASLTPEPLLLHRVDASQLQTPVRIVHGDVEQRQCRPGMCQGLPTCSDVHCEGHPCNDVTDDERDPVALRWFLAGYLSFIAACMATVAYADHIYHWLTK